MKIIFVSASARSLRFIVSIATVFALLATVGTLVRGQDTSEESTPAKVHASATPKGKASKRKKKKKTAKPSVTPEPKKSPSPKMKAAEQHEEDSPTPIPSPKGSAHKGAKKSDQTASPSATPEPSKTPAPTKAGSPKASPADSPTPERASPPPPRAIAVQTPAPTPVAPVAAPPPPADITVQKSGFEREQGFEPPPPPPKRSGFWPFSRPIQYHYLSNAVIEELRRAPVQRGRWKFIVVHNSGTRQGNAKAFDYYHRRIRRMQNGLAYHFVIGNGTSSGNGQVEVGDRWRRQINGGHVHSDYLNNIALGICLVGDFNRDQPTRAQLESCEELIRYLRTRCGKADGRDIPVRPHREVNPPRWATDCPGDAFPYGFFRKF